MCIKCKNVLTGCKAGWLEAPATMKADTDRDAETDMGYWGCCRRVLDLGGGGGRAGWGAWS